MLGVPLDFDPGTNAIYSNVGYIIMGEVIATVSQKPYWEYVIDNVLVPMGIKDARLQPRDGHYHAKTAHRHLAGTLTPLLSLRLPMTEAAGGWIASAVDMARYLTNLDGSRGECVLTEKSRGFMVEPPPAPLKPRDNGTYFGLGWDTVAKEGKNVSYFKDGCVQGMRTYMKRLPNGLNWALLFNATMEIDSIDMQITNAAVQEIRKKVEAIEKHPDVDLFKDFE
jgi:N-acyl-D-amino-acid deacylase